MNLVWKSENSLRCSIGKVVGSRLATSLNQDLIVGLYFCWSFWWHPGNRVYIHPQGGFAEVSTQIVLKQSWSQLTVEIFETNTWRVSHLQVVNSNDSILICWVCSKLTIRIREWHEAMECYFSKVVDSKPATLLKKYFIAGWGSSVIVEFFICSFCLLCWGF